MDNVNESFIAWMFEELPLIILIFYVTNWSYKLKQSIRFKSHEWVGNFSYEIVGLTQNQNEWVHFVVVELASSSSEATIKATDADQREEVMFYIQILRKEEVRVSVCVWVRV